MKTAIFALLLALASNAGALQFEAVFNEPTFKARSATSGTTTIEDKLISLIRSARPGSKINVALYTMDRMPIAQAFLDAERNKVSVSVVMDGGSKKEGEREGSALNAIKKLVTYCSGSCNGFHINHNKFFLFSDLADGRRNVVAQTSANMTESQLGNYNDLLILDGDRALYDGFIAYWQDLKADDGRLTVDDIIWGAGSIEAYIFPRLFGDPVLKTLENVSCGLPGSLIRVAESRFENFRGDIAKRLAELAQSGCDVKVIARDEPEQNSPGTKVAKYLGGNLIVVPYRGETSTNSIHSKMILIDASQGGSTRKIPTVMTGSHNLNFTSLKTNDEILFKIADRQLFDQYIGHWERMRAAQAQTME